MILTTRPPVSKELLLEKVSELDIFRLFCRDFSKIGKKFKSPILVEGRPNVGKEAAVILWKASKSLVFYDFRLGKSFNCINFAILMTGLSFADVIQYLSKRFGLMDGTWTKIRQAPIHNEETIERAALPCIITVKYESWKKESLDYWLQYGWKPFMLDLANIRPIEKFWLAYNSDKRIEYDRTKIGHISFTYDFFKVDNIFRRKIYCPLTDNKNLKWKNNTNKGIIQALNTIDEHIDTLYLTSSMKDCGPYWTLLGHPCAIAPNSESTLLYPDQVRMMKQMSDHQVIWYDNDATGRFNALKQANLYGFEARWNPMGSPKDQSDYVKERGLREFKKLII
jgi:hypothetical protein